MKTVASPAKQKYIADLAMAAAAGKSLRTYPRSEARAALAILKRAGIRVPKPVRKVSEPPPDPKVVALAKVEQRLKQEAAAFVRSVAIARAILALQSVGNENYGRELILLPAAKLPSWFVKKAEYAGVPLEIEDEEIPGHDLAFTNYTEDLRKRLMTEAGIE